MILINILLNKLCCIYIYNVLYVVISSFISINYLLSVDKSQKKNDRAHKFIRKNRKLHKFATTNNNFKQECDLVTVLVCINLRYYRENDVGYTLHMTFRNCCSSQC